MDRYKVMIVEDQAMPRKLFEQYVNGSDRFTLCCSLKTTGGAVDYVNENSVDLILMDVFMGDATNGLEAAARIKAAHPEIKIIIVTSMPELTYIKKAKALGAESFWYKDFSEMPILEIMDRTMAGESIYPTIIPVIPIGDAKSCDFSDREVDVLCEIVKGCSNKEIGETLNMSELTVKTHIQHLLQKTGFKNRTELAVRVRNSGLIIP